MIGSLFYVVMYLRVVSSYSRTAFRNDARVGNFESFAEQGCCGCGEEI
jgi:hypothetical protein